MTIPISASNFSPFDRQKPTCEACGTHDALDFRFSCAYQPIVDVLSRTVYAHEALVRGPNGEGAGAVLARVTDANRYRFDQACRVRAIKGAAHVGISERLSINFLPNAIHQPEACIRTTLEAARASSFPIERIIFEATEGEVITDGRRLAHILREYRRTGFLTAIDDFGAGYAGLNLLADFQPDIVKLDMHLVRGIDSSPARQAIVGGVVKMCRELEITVLAEGVETAGERDYFVHAGVTLMQGYLFARPAFQARGVIDPTAWGG